MKKPDLLVLVALWDFLLAFLMLIGIFAVAFIGLPASLIDVESIDRTFIIFGISIGIFVLIILFVLGLIAGIGLLQGKNWGRIMSIVTAALTAFSFPIGTAIGVLIIVYLTKQEVKEYFSGISV